jgi:hypothetical protein
MEAADITAARRMKFRREIMAMAAYNSEMNEFLAFQLFMKIFLRKTVHHLAILKSYLVAVNIECSGSAVGFR